MNPSQAQIPTMSLSLLEKLEMIKGCELTVRDELLPVQNHILALLLQTEQGLKKLSEQGLALAERTIDMFNQCSAANNQESVRAQTGLNAALEAAIEFQVAAQKAADTHGAMAMQTHFMNDALEKVHNVFFDRAMELDLQFVDVTLAIQQELANPQTTGPLDLTAEELHAIDQFILQDFSDEIEAPPPGTGPENAITINDSDSPLATGLNPEDADDTFGGPHQPEPKATNPISTRNGPPKKSLGVDNAADSSPSTQWPKPKKASGPPTPPQTNSAGNPSPEERPSRAAEWEGAINPFLCAVAHYGQPEALSWIETLTEMIRFDRDAAAAAPQISSADSGIDGSSPTFGQRFERELIQEIEETLRHSQHPGPNGS